jgi:uncharacterized membrane protein
LLPFFLVFTYCRHDENDFSNIEQVCFNPDVQAIFTANCAISGCHSSPGGESGLVLDNYQGIMEGITPGDPLNSEIYKAITNEWIEMMPPDNPLTEQQRTIIRIWIEQGAENTNCSQGK